MPGFDLFDGVLGARQADVVVFAVNLDRFDLFPGCQ